MDRKRDNRIRILHIIDSLNIGGTEKQALEIARRVDHERFDVTVVTFNKEGPLLDPLIRAGIKLKEYRISGGFYRPDSMLQILKLAKFMRLNRIEIVQTYGFYSTIPGIIAALIAKTPVRIASKRELSKFLSPNKKKMEKFLWQFCDKIVVNAFAIKQHLSTKEKVLPEKIEVIYNCVDLGDYTKSDQIDHRSSKKNIVGMVASFREQKDHKTFLNAASIVSKARPDTRFLMIGSGFLENTIKDYAIQIGVDGFVKFCGRKEGKELVDIVKNFRVKVLASTNEGIPNALLEAMYLGIPVVTNPSGGIPEVVKEGDTGFLFPYKRPDLLSEKILYLLENEDVARSIGNRAKKMVSQHFSPDTMIHCYISLYERLYKDKIL